MAEDEERKDENPVGNILAAAGAGALAAGPGAAAAYAVQEAVAAGCALAEEKAKEEK